MSQIDRLNPYLQSPVTIRAPKMTLLARDFEPPLAEGEGEFEIMSEREFRYRLTGLPVDLKHIRGEKSGWGFRAAGALYVGGPGVGTRAHVKSWIKIRNSVMHGKLVSPYSSKEDDQIILDLADMLRALTGEAARRALAG